MAAALGGLYGAFQEPVPQADATRFARTPRTASGRLRSGSGARTASRLSSVAAAREAQAAKKPSKRLSFPECQVPLRVPSRRVPSRRIGRRRPPRPRPPDLAGNKTSIVKDHAGKRDSNRDSPNSPPNIRAAPEAVNNNLSKSQENLSKKLFGRAKRLFVAGKTLLLQPKDQLPKLVGL